MNYLPPGSQNQNPQFVNNKDTIISQEQQSDNPENWENCLRAYKDYHEDFFLLVIK